MRGRNAEGHVLGKPQLHSQLLRGGHGKLVSVHMRVWCVNEARLCANFVTFKLIILRLYICNNTVILKFQVSKCLVCDG